MPAVFAGQILRKTSSLGHAQIRRVYGTNNAITSWSDAPSFKPVFAGGTKNAADILLSIEAIQFAMRDRVDAIAIASSDRDLSHVAHALREMGRHILGLGEKKAPAEFRLACTDFIELKKPAEKVATEELDTIDAALRAAFDAIDPDGIGILLKDINPRVRRHVPDFKISASTDKNWPTYFRNRPQLYSIIGEAAAKRVLIARNTE